MALTGGLEPVSRAKPDADQAVALVVVIPHYNDRDRLMRCLGALMAQDLDGVSVVVVDNASAVDMAPVADAFPQVRVLVQPEKGAFAARNLGVAETTAPWIAFLDADCVPEDTWVSRAKQIAAGDRRTLTGGQVTVFDETPGPRSGAEAFETVFAFDQASYIRDKGFSVTANLIVSRAVFEAVGPFRAGVSEDLDWGQRATGQGHPLVYDPDLSVAHPTRSDWPALARKWRRLTDEGFGLVRGSMKGRLMWGLKALAMPLSILAHAPRVLRHPALTVGERGRGLLTLVRLRLTRMVWMLRQALSGARP